VGGAWGGGYDSDVGFFVIRTHMTTSLAASHSGGEVQYSDSSHGYELSHPVHISVQNLMALMVSHQ
jgi:hypothetical protein